MAHAEDISRTMLWDAMYEAIQAGMAAGMQNIKTIEGKTIEDWIKEYIVNLIGTEEDNDSQ
ncbi:hypothetical protein [Niastella sp. OAS944]|uniref:hypothetical protein n=1 Tax=Niastella sp. OAS944 TaxID=2664089 RepID=UPI003484FF2A|nr:hypothetical protein [Chitinophagaceae bacterium OAS944]